MPNVCKIKKKFQIVVSCYFTRDALQYKKDVQYAHISIHTFLSKLESVSFEDTF